MSRVSREEIHMATALLWSSRSKCKRLAVGCVITDSEMRRVMSIGYNGPARGLDNESCTGEPGKCGCLHAEDNAVAFVDSTVKEKVAFVTHQPCGTCAQRLIQANIARVFYLHPYRDNRGLAIFEAVGIPATQLLICMGDLQMALLSNEHP